jgi:hypothetical protein
VASAPTLSEVHRKVTNDHAGGSRPTAAPTTSHPAQLPEEGPGISAFALDGEQVFHTCPVTSIRSMEKFQPLDLA